MKLEGRKHFKKISKSMAIILTFALLLSLMLTACAPATRPPEEQEQERTDEAAEPVLKELDPNISATVSIFNFGSDTDKQIYAEAINRFNERFPNVTVEDTFTPVTTWGEYTNRIVTLIAGGESPDIINIAIEGTRLLTDRNILLQLDDIIAADPTAPELLDDLDPQLIEAFEVDGRIYQIPHSWNNMVIYYNTKMFEEAGLELPSSDWT